VSGSRPVKIASVIVAVHSILLAFFFLMKSFCLKIEPCILFDVIRFFCIRGASEKVARGFALGMVANFFPTFGFGVLISGFFARLFGGNPVAGSVGAILNSLLVGLTVYVLLRLLCQRTRPAALAYFRRHAQERQSKLSLHRPCASQ